MILSFTWQVFPAKAETAGPHEPREGTGCMTLKTAGLLRADGLIYATSPAMASAGLTWPGLETWADTVMDREIFWCFLL